MSWNTEGLGARIRATAGPPQGRGERSLSWEVDTYIYASL